MGKKSGFTMLRGQICNTEEHGSVRIDSEHEVTQL